MQGVGTCWQLSLAHPDVLQLMKCHGHVEQTATRQSWGVIVYTWKVQDCIGRHLPVDGK